MKLWFYKNIIEWTARVWLKGIQINPDLNALPDFATDPGLHCLSRFEPPHNKTNKMTVRPAKTQISLGIRPVWSEYSLCAQWVAKDLSFLHADSEDSDHTGRMARLVCVFTGRTCYFVGFVMRRLICLSEHFGSIWYILDLDQLVYHKTKYEPQHDKTNTITCAPGEYSDQNTRRVLYG